MHQVYKELHKENPDVFQNDSISEFLASSIKCDSDSELMLPKLECINGNCKNRCAINLPSTTLLFPSQPEKTINDEYFYAAGKKVSIKRTARFDKKETLCTIYVKCFAKGKVNWIHRHRVISNRIFWDNFSHEYTHLDFSENIALRPKSEVQSAHFSGRQQTLHCTVSENSSDPNVPTRQYLYHLSDDTRQYSVLSFAVVTSIIENNPSLIKNGKLVIKSGNSSTQCKN